MERLSADDKITLSDLRFQKAVEALSDAQKSLDMQMYKTSVNRAYYAVLNCTRSLLILKGLDPIRHDGVKTMLLLHFIKTGLLSKDALLTFKQLLALRTDVDYGDFDFTDKLDAQKAVEMAEKFLALAETLRSELINELKLKGDLNEQTG